MAPSATGDAMMIRRGREAWEHVEAHPYSNEAALQRLLAESPNLVLPRDGEQAVTITEVEIPEVGRVDVLVVASDGSLTLVEAKLHRNPEVRRAVVGQLLAYAGGLWRLTYDRLDDGVRSRRQCPLADLVQKVAESDFDPAAFRRSVADNLRAGRFRLVFAVDEITPELRCVVEYLNGHTDDDTEVTALELRLAKVDDIEILDPRVYGEETAFAKRATRASNRWSEADFFKALEASASDDAVAAVRQLHRWASPRVRRFFWGVGQAPSMIAVFESPEGDVQPYGVSLTGAVARFSINFRWIRRRPRLAVERFLDDLRTLPAVGTAERDVRARDFARHVTMPLDELAPHLPVAIDALDRLLAAPAEISVPA